MLHNYIDDRDQAAKNMQKAIAELQHMIDIISLNQRKQLYNILFSMIKLYLREK